MNRGKEDFHPQNGELELHARRRLTFKKASRDDLLTINVSGTIFFARSSIFTKHPGKCFIFFVLIKTIWNPAVIWLKSSATFN